MNSKGIRISDGKDGLLVPTLSDILEEIPDGDSLNWSLLFLDGVLNPGYGDFLAECDVTINNSENGLLIDWSDLQKLSRKFFQVYAITILGSKDVRLLHRYETEQEMYKACDLVVELIDCSFWEVYSGDEIFLNKLKGKFQDVSAIMIQV